MTRYQLNSPFQKSAGWLAVLLIGSFAWFCLSGGVCGALVANWKADTYTSGTWSDTAAGTPIPATPVNSPVVVANAFGTHKGINFTGGKYFTVPANRNPLSGKTSFTLVAVFRPTAVGTTGGSWYQASGLIGMEQPNVVNDFGFGWTGDGGGQVKAGLGIAGSGDRTITSPTVALNTTHVAVFTHNAATGLLTLYVDGQQVATSSGTAGAGRNASDFALGAMTSGGSNPFPGLIAEIQIYDTVENGAALSSSLLATYVPPPVITSFSSNKATAFEGEAVQLSWVANTSQMTGALSVTIKRDATTIFTGTSATGNINTNIPDLSSSAQPVIYTLTVTEIGGGGLTGSAQVTVNADPGIPVATAQSGLSTVGTNPLAITLAGSDPNGSALTYTIVTPPAHGLLTGSGTARSYTANAGYYGSDTFTFKVSDGKYDSAPETVALTVLAPPTAPSGISLSNTQVIDPTASGAFIANILSADVNVNEAHTYALVAGAGSIDNPRFSVVGSQLRAAQSFAGLSGTSYSIRLRSTDALGLSVEQVFILIVGPPPTGVVINELHYNGIDNTVLSDFIELYNSSTTTINLTGWRISGGVDFAFPSGTTIAPGTYLLIAQQPSVILSKWGKTALGPWTGSLSSDGETVRLRNASDAVVCEVDYKVGFPWPVASDGDGASMELINPSLDPSLGSSWRASIIPANPGAVETATPAAQNLKFATNAPPNIRQVQHAPLQPSANTPIVVTAKVTDPDGVASVQLLYQSVFPGNFIPSTLPNAIVNKDIATTPLQGNPAFENAANWTTIAMHDDGINGDELGGDGIYTASIPGQPNRTLVRYRITVADNLGESIRVPYPDDASLNFACFVYNGVPAYQGTSAATLQKLPVYQFLTRKSDYDDCVAYNSSKQLNGGTGAWTFENWEAAFVFEGVVYDHIRYRLHGGNGRYYFSGKRAFRMFFNKGYDFVNRDNDGKLYPTKWNSLVTENCWENRGTLTYCLNEAVNFHLWNQLGVPAPLGNWGHFRVLTGAQEQPDPWNGDFWGLIYLHEDYDGRFLDAHNLAKGNLYKLTRDSTSGVSQQRYQAPFAVKNGSDHAYIYNNLRAAIGPAQIDANVNLDRWCYYHALAQAVRHYDYWPSGDNNGAYYFEPTYTAANGNRGKLWILPNDVDATWGPTWNSGEDRVYDALFAANTGQGGDATTSPTLWPRYFNAVREVRDLLWQQDQIDPLIEQFAAVVAPFEAADAARWKGAPAASGNYDSLGGAGIVSLANLVQDMKNFAWVGGSWPGGNVGAGGQAAFLDSLQTGVSNSEGAQIPDTPTIAFVGTAAHPLNDLRFQTSAFSDPQGAASFSAVQWRMAEVTDPNAPAYVPGEKLKLEWNASYISDEITTFANQFRFPAASCVAGHTYRARVRHKDITGRWSHWSAPVQFTAAAADVSAYTSSLVISEIMYHPSPATSAELALGWGEDDFEYLEVRNVSAASIELTDVRFTKGIDFDFAPGTTLAAGASILVVRNVDAFNSRYGAGKPIAGTWQAGDSLSNGGEQIKLSFGAGPAILDFVYDDVAPWPTEPDRLGYSLVLVKPETRPDPSLPANWRASRVVGGSPGGDDRPTFAAWAVANGVSNDPEGDDDHDGIKNWLEYALAGDPHAEDSFILPTGQTQSISVGGTLSSYLTITFVRLLGAEEIGYHVEFGTSLGSWDETAVRVSTAFNGDGTTTETWRAPQPMADGSRQFLRLRVSSL